MNVVFVKQGGRNFLFSVPDNVTLQKGDRVLVDTMYGEADGTCATESFIIGDHALKQIVAATGAYFPLKFVVGKIEIIRFDTRLLS